MYVGLKCLKSSLNRKIDFHPEYVRQVHFEMIIFASAFIFYDNKFSLIDKLSCGNPTSQLRIYRNGAEM